MSEGVTAVGVGGALEPCAPVLHVVTGARVDLHVIPIIGAIVREHGLSQPLGGPLVHVVVAPETDGHTIHGIATQCGANALQLVHLGWLLSVLILHYRRDRRAGTANSEGAVPARSHPVALPCIVSPAGWRLKTDALWQLPESSWHRQFTFGSA